uniref:Putative secreted peptide n=1 Tax=Anopheles braziliensis TaxID=58242 RepID=A0A2M3ZN30_9DIPT
MCCVFFICYLHFAYGYPVSLTFFHLFSFSHYSDIHSQTAAYFSSTLCCCCCSLHGPWFQSIFLALSLTVPETNRSKNEENTFNKHFNRLLSPSTPLGRRRSRFRAFLRFTSVAESSGTSTTGRRC